MTFTADWLLLLIFHPLSVRWILFRQIQQAITEAFFGRKVTPFIVLDDLQLATPTFLNELHLLFNFTMDAHNPFILVLCGMPFSR